MIAPELYDKVWVATLDDRTRHAHRVAHGQKAPFSGTFDVGGEDLRYPGDPLGAPENTYNCRCHIRIESRTSLTASGQENRMTQTVEQITEVLANIKPSPSSVAMERLMTEYVAMHPDTTAEFASKLNGHLARQVSAAHAETFNALVADAMEPDVAGEMYRTFTDQAFAVIGSPTSDGRMLATDIDLKFRTFPLPLMWCEQTGEGHEDAYTIGVIEDARVDGEHVVASGYLLNTEDSGRWYEIGAHGVSNVSVDLVASSYSYTDEHGAELDEEQLADRFENNEPIVLTFTKAELIGATFVATPAFDTRIALNETRESRDVALVASAAAEFKPRVYDHRLFENPNLDRFTWPTIGEDGRVYGHLAAWDACHRSIQTECVIAPRSPSNYGHFLTSPSLQLDDGSRLPVGRLTVVGGHASEHISAAAAIAHYDDVTTCFALVRVGEDAHGIWFSGVPAPWATPEQVEMGLSAPLSGDWRDFGQGLDLISAHAVNTPALVAVRGRDDDQGRPIALVASLGAPRRSRRGGLTRDEVKEAVVEALEETTRRQSFEAKRKTALARASVYAQTPREQAAKILARLK